MNRILGVSRSHRFSPNSIDRDNAIFQAVAVALRGSGYEVECVGEDDLTRQSLAEAPCLVYSMARSEKALSILTEAEEKGIPVVNSANALTKGTRTALARCFERHDLPVAESRCFDVNAMKPALCFETGKRYWLKRGDACAQNSGDVRFVASEKDLEEAADDYKARGITDVLLSPHIEGDLVKFYGVEDTDFFHLYYPTRGACFSKFGLERFNGSPTGYAFSENALKKSADACAAVSGFTVYGGDAVVRPDGSFLIIDFNDWPSFSRCCDEAAEAIAERLRKMIKAKHRI